MLGCQNLTAYACYLSVCFPAALFPATRGESAPAAGLTPGHSGPREFCCGVHPSVKLNRQVVQTSVLVWGNRNLTWDQCAWPLRHRGGDRAPNIWLDQVPAHGLGQEEDRDVVGQHLLGLQVLLVAAGRVSVGLRHPDEVVVLLVLIEGHVVGAGRQEKGGPVRWIGVVGAPASRARDLELPTPQPRAEGGNGQRLQG